MDDEYIYDSYDMDGALARTYRLAVTDDRGLIIEARHVVDMFYSFSAIVISPDKHGRFLLAIFKAKEKFVEWSKAARENGITNMDKLIEVNCPTVDVLWNDAIGAKGEDVWFHDREIVRNVELSFKFLVLKGEAMLLIQTGPLQSSSRSSSRGTVLRFVDATRLNLFIVAISAEKVQHGLAMKRKRDGLFKQ